jgi:hypothetical protein
MPTQLRHILLSVALVATAACSKKGGDDGRHDCDDVEAAMRRIDPARTKDAKPGVFAKLCKEQPEKFTQARIDCTVASKNYDELAVCVDPSKAPLEPAEGATAALAWRDVPKFGAKLEVPGNVTVEQKDTNAHLTNGTFKINLFVVDEYSQKSAAEVKASLQKEPGFVKFTKEDAGAKTWHFDYELAEGKAGTSARIDIGKPLDCGVHKVAPEVMAMASAACAGAKAI